jgi:hypothetical protein
MVDWDRPKFPTLIQASHVPIIMHMGIKLIIILHFTHNYSVKGLDDYMILDEQAFKIGIN